MFGRNQGCCRLSHLGRVSPAGTAVDLESQVTQAPGCRNWSAGVGACGRHRRGCADVRRAPVVRLALGPRSRGWSALFDCIESTNLTVRIPDVLICRRNSVDDSLTRAGSLLLMKHLDCHVRTADTVSELRTSTSSTRAACAAFAIDELQRPEALVRRRSGARVEPVVGALARATYSASSKDARCARAARRRASPVLDYASVRR